MSADLSEGCDVDPWGGAWVEIQGWGVQDVQGACLEVGHVEEDHDVLQRSAAPLPAAPSAAGPSSLRTLAAPCGTPAAQSKAAASGAPAKEREKKKNHNLNGTRGKV